MKIFPEKNEELITAVIISFFIGIIVGVSLFSTILKEEILIAIITLLSVFIGAHYAFILEKRRREEEEKLAQIRAGNSVIFELIKTFNQLKAYNLDVLEKHIKNPMREFLIPPHIGFTSLIQVNYDLLSFLFETKDPNILMKIYSIEDDMRSLNVLIKKRSKLFIEVVQPKLEEGGAKQGEQLTLRKHYENVGERNCVILKEMTDSIIDYVDTLPLFVEQIIKNLEGLLKGLYPGYTIIKMKQEDTSKSTS